MERTALLVVSQLVITCVLDSQCSWLRGTALYCRHSPGRVLTSLSIQQR